MRRVTGATAVAAAGMVLALAGMAGRAEATKQDGGRTAGVRGFACAVWTFGGAAREVRIAFELPAGMESCVFLTRPYRTDDCLGTTYATREVAAPRVTSQGFGHRNAGGAGLGQRCGAIAQTVTALGGAG